MSSPQVAPRMSTISAPYTVTNSFKRGLMMKTYARSVRRVWDGEDAPIAKKIFIERPKLAEDAGEHLERAIRETSIAASSSPSRKNSTIFSAGSQDDDTITPPSSPPRITPPPVNTRKPTFPFLKRKQDASREGTEPLSEVVNSSDMRSSVPPNKKPKLIQTQLDLGVETRKTCSECGMEYIPSNTEDATLHRMYHDMDKDGVELGKAFMKSSAMKWAYEVAHIEGLVVVVDRKVSPPARLQVKKVLEVVTKELSAPEIDDAILWSQKSLVPTGESSKKTVKQHVSEERNDHKSDRYKVFLHIKDGKCVGLCLAERITEGYKVKANKLNKEDSKETAMRPISSSISIEEEGSPAVVGISRIWTCKAFRRKGIATNLLDCVMNHFIYGMEIEKDEIAFSQPTESGGKLAREWFGADSGWLVYNE